MSTKPTDPASRAAPLADRYMQGDPIPVAEAVEANSESTWAMFSDVPPAPEVDFMDTVPASFLDEAALAKPPKRSE